MKIVSIASMNIGSQMELHKVPISCCILLRFWVACQNKHCRGPNTPPHIDHRHSDDNVKQHHDDDDDDDQHCRDDDDQDHPDD